jgi:RimJ/RimL family protein N-acetyltransferase
VPAIVPPPLIDGDLALRAPVPADVPAIAAICQDADIQRWTRVPSPYTEEDARTFVLMATGALAEGTGAHLLLTPHAGPTGQIWGCVGVGRHARDLTGELGYWVAPEARGRGLATRAARLLAGFAFERLGLAALHLTAAVANEPSNRVARAVGFQHVGVLRSAKPDGPSGDAAAPRTDVNIYDLLPGDLTMT